MIITVTPNPSVDRTVTLDRFGIGEVNRGERSWSEPSGKGVNVALALHAHGVPVRAVMPVGDSVGSQLEQLLTDRGLPTTLVPISGEVRANISLAHPDGSVTKINEPGPSLAEHEVEALFEAVVDVARSASLIVCGGSLPAGVPTDFYARIVTWGASRALPVIVDSSGPALAASLTAGPELIKPNAEELAELSGRPLQTFGDVIDAAQEIRSRGARSVLASLGADGAILVDDLGVIHASAPAAKVVSPVGAGDATLAGFLAGFTAGRGGRQRALAAAVHWGAAAVAQETTLFTPPDGSASPAIVETRIDRGRPLADHSEAHCLPGFHHDKPSTEDDGVATMTSDVVTTADDEVVATRNTE